MLLTSMAETICLVSCKSIEQDLLALARAWHDKTWSKKKIKIKKNKIRKLTSKFSWSTLVYSLAYHIFLPNQELKKYQWNKMAYNDTYKMLSFEKTKLITTKLLFLKKII
jgi:hypothetical protein